MAFTEMAFTPATGLTDTTTYPTQPASETEIRSAVQGISDQLRDYINDTLLVELTDTTTSTSGADYIGSAPIEGITGENVHAQIVDLKTQLDGVSAGAVSDGSITTAKLANDAVTADKIADDAVDSEHIADDAVDSAQIADGAIIEALIDTGAVTETKIGTGAVTATKIGSGAVTETKIGTAAVTATKIGAGAVSDTKIGNRTIADTLAPTTDAAVLTTLLSNIAYMLKRITGESTWRTAPDTTIAALHTKITNKITVSATEPTSPTTNDIWIDIS